MWSATGYTEGNTFIEVKQHTQHGDIAGEIEGLQLLKRCRKRAADELTHSLRHIFATETHPGANAAGFSVVFA